MRKFLLLVFLALILLGFLAYTFGGVVQPGEIAVRQVKLDPFQGFSERGLKPGYHWSVPMVSELHIVPTTLQSMQLERESKAGGPESQGQLEVQTTDGSKVIVDISLLYRFLTEPGEFKEGDRAERHGGPKDLITELGLTPSAWRSRIHQAAENELRRALGALSTSEFYVPKLREKQLQQAQTAINTRLRPYGINVEAVLLRRYTYDEVRIDNAIFQKNLQKQEERLNAAASKLAEARARTEKVEATMDAQIRTRKVEGESKAVVLRSEGDLYEAQKRAEADLEVARAEAEVDRLRASALAAEEGATVYVAREMAALARALKGGVMTDMEPFDLERWIKLLGVDRAGKASSQQ